MSDGFDFISQVVPLGGEHTLTHNLSPYVPKLRAFRRRRRLQRSALFRNIGAAVGRITFGIAHSRFAHEPQTPKRFLRTVAWNVERGLRLDALLAFARENEQLNSADIILLNECDIGMGRSGNRNVPEELARTLGLNVVFGASYWCLVGGNIQDRSDGATNHLGLHGNAVLSRYPITHAETFSLPITHDIFETREKRLGHRKALWARIETPQGPLTALCLHLDSEGSPHQRGQQIQHALDKIAKRGVDDTVLIGGDLNTTTYDIASLPRLCKNLAYKFTHGGFPHVIHHYLYPWLHYERPVFDVLFEHRYRWHEFNALGIGTMRYEVGDFGSESKVGEYMPGPVTKYIAHNLKPWGGVAQLKLDWLAGRGIAPLRSGAVIDGVGRSSHSPHTVVQPRAHGQVISDHDPVFADIVVLPAAGRRVD